MASMHPPKKNTAFILYLTIRDADGDLVSAAATLDSEVSIDGAAFADATNEATEIGTTGIYSLSLTATEMNGDAIIVQTKTSTAGAKTAVNVMYTSARLNDDLAYPTVSGRSLDVSAGGEAGVDWANVGTPGSTVSLSATTVATVTTATTATNVTTVNGLAASVITAASIATGAITAAKFGAGAIDAAAIATGAIDADAIAADAITAAKIADGAIDAATFAVGAIDNAAFNVTETLTANPAAGGITTASFAAGAIDNAAFNVTETLTANPATGGIVAASFGAGAIDAAAIAADAIGASELATDAANEIADAILDRANGIETGVTLRAAVRYIGASWAGQVSGAGTATEVFLGLDAITTRLTVTADASGNRTAVTLG